MNKTIINWHTFVENFHKSTASEHHEENCVEVGSRDGMVAIRDTKQKHVPSVIRPVIVVSQPTFGAFLADVAAF